MLTLCLLSTCGCALLNLQTDKVEDFSRPLDADELAEFERTRPVRKVVRLETAVMAASASDRRIRELVWEELDESGLMSPENRRRLNQSGIRVGVSGGTIPWALDSLRRGERHQLVKTQRPEVGSGINQSVGTHVAIPEGGRSLIEIPSVGGSIIIPAGQIAGLNDGAELEAARRVLELTPVEYGNGWVLIRFLPQIHHGAITTRYSIAQGAETMPVRQRIQPLYEQQFELKLHANETAVIGCQESEGWTVGQMLFQSEQLTSTTENLIALQLKTVEHVAGQQTVHVDYSKY